MFAPVDRVFVPAYQPPAQAIHVSNSSGSKIYNAIRHFFLACTAVAGIAFLATGSGSAFATALILGTIAFCLYFPESVSSSTYRTQRTYWNHTPQRETIIIHEQAPQSHVFASRPPRERRQNRHQFEIPVDAFVPDHRARVVVDERAFERHPVGNQQAAPQPRYEEPVVVVDLQERHAVGGRQARQDAPPNGPFDPFERHPVGNG